MSLDRIPGEDNLFIGSLFAASRPELLVKYNISHILSVLTYTASEIQAHKDNAVPGITRAYVQVDDIEEEDLLVHFPRIVRFIDDGLRPRQRLYVPPTEDARAEAEGSTADDGGGSVYVHCAMGKSRSATAVIAFLLWKYPSRFGGGSGGGTSSAALGSRLDGAVSDAAATAEADDTVQRALALVRGARPIVEPNPGFLRQLALWWRMGCPADSDAAVERQPVYQRWLYQKDIEESTALGRAPERLWFGDEAQAADAGTTAAAAATQTFQLRCKICRRVLAASPFILPHNPYPNGKSGDINGCAHYFVEPLSWMRPVLEQGVLDGRLMCPNPKCGTSIGRYSWQGFKCTCREWVCPAFSLQKSKVDQMCVVDKADGSSALSTTSASVPQFSIRLPPSAKGPSKTENL